MASDIPAQDPKHDTSIPTGEAAIDVEQDTEIDAANETDELPEGGSTPGTDPQTDEVFHKRALPVTDLPVGHEDAHRQHPRP